MQEVVRRFKFDAAHHLPGYKGKCKRVHGHTWFVDIGVKGQVDPSTGMVVDFSELKKVVAPLLEELDHHNLNHILQNPTAENIVHYIADWLLNHALIHLFPNFLGDISLVRVWESPDSYAEWRA